MATYPLPVIVVSLLVTGLGAAGLASIRLENNAIKLWIPQQSDFTRNYNWLYDNHPPEFRQHSIIVHGEDILTPEAIQKVRGVKCAIRSAGQTKTSLAVSSASKLKLKGSYADVRDIQRCLHDCDQRQQNLGEYLL